MAFIPYLHFRGTCRDAMTFYADVFGAGEPIFMRYSDAPPGAAPSASDRIMHSQIDLPDGLLMASDFPEGIAGDSQAAVSVMTVATDLPEAERLFARLSEGGEAGIPFGPTFFSPGFGMVRDRFGTHWIVSAPMQPPA
jgi:PhnB protein